MEAIPFEEIVVFATLWKATANVINIADAKNLKGKIVIDAINLLNF